MFRVMATLPSDEAVNVVRPGLFKVNVVVFVAMMSLCTRFTVSTPDALTVAV